MNKNSIGDHPEYFNSEKIVTASASTGYPMTVYSLVILKIPYFFILKMKIYNLLTVLTIMYASENWVLQKNMKQK